MAFDSTIPVLQVSDVSKSMQWYKDVLGLDGWAFPEDGPYTFALLNRDGAELMLQASDSRDVPSHQGWSLYIRLKNNPLLELAEHVRQRAPLSREPERMPYRDVEFAVADPDGHEIVLSEQSPEDIAVPSVR